MKLAGKEILIPPRGLTVYPFKRLAIGDYFRVALARNHSVRNSAKDYGKRNGMRFNIEHNESWVVVERIA